MAVTALDTSPAAMMDDGAEQGADDPSSPPPLLARAARGGTKNKVVLGSGRQTLLWRERPPQTAHAPDAFLR
ncbi:hypothetical protein ACOMHN_008343 [Nucella lapillus]